MKHAFDRLGPLIKPISAALLALTTTPSTFADTLGAPLAIAYATEHWRNTLDLYLPDSACTPYPLVIYIHGGGWLAGDSTQVAAHIESLLARRFAVAAINYRWSFQAPFPAQIHDCKAAVRFLRGSAATYNLDPDRIVAFGDSAGGHLAALLGTSAFIAHLEGDVGEFDAMPSDIAAVGDVNGPTDLFALGAILNSDDSIVSKLFNWPIQDIIDNQRNPKYAELVALVHDANPITHIDATDPPFHIIHGDADELIPLNQSELLHDALINSIVNSIFTILPGASHKIAAHEYVRLFDFFLDELDIRLADLNCDGAVGVPDLLAVINAWGSCAPEQSCVEDLNFDDEIGVPDLLAVINSWG